MSARQILLFAATALALALAYVWISFEVMAIAFRWQQPTWWNALFNDRGAAVLWWLQIPHTLAILVSALPIALCAIWIDRKRTLELGVAVATLAVVIALIPTLVSDAGSALSQRGLWLAAWDHLKLLLAVPALAWVISRVPSNKSLERTRER